MTDNLLDQLAGELRPARRGLIPRRLAVAAGLGGIAALLGMALLIGFRPDLGQALTTPMFWMKLAFTAAVGGVGLWSVERLARPSSDANRRIPWLALPIGAIVILAAVQIGGAPPAALKGLIMGDSAALCPWFIAATAVPLFVAMIWAVRSSAPTNLSAAGAVAGLSAGGVAGVVYCLHCPETGAPFVAIWYTLGMAIPAVVGALTGPILLRWSR